MAKVRALIRGHFKNFGPNMHTVRVFYIDFTYLSRDRRGEILEKRRAYERFLIDLIASGQRHGLFASDIDPRMSAVAILTMINSIHVWYRPGGPTSMAEIADKYEKMVLHTGHFACHSVATAAKGRKTGHARASSSRKRTASSREDTKS